MKLINLVNKSYGRLTVLRRGENTTDGHIRWWCKCVCGTEKLVHSSGLKNGSTTSCGCRWKEWSETTKKRPYERLYNAFIRSSKKRKYNVDLTYEQFLDFTNVLHCYYCGDIVEWDKHHSSDLRYHGYNLDRKDNEVGYTKENCVVCCPLCNYMKRTMGYEEFINHIRKILQCQDQVKLQKT